MEKASEKVRKLKLHDGQLILFTGGGLRFRPCMVWLTVARPPFVPPLDLETSTANNTSVWEWGGGVGEKKRGGWGGWVLGEVRIQRIHFRCKRPS